MSESEIIITWTDGSQTTYIATSSTIEDNGTQLSFTGYLKGDGNEVHIPTRVTIANVRVYTRQSV